MHPELWRHELRRGLGLWLALALALMAFAVLETLIYPQIRDSYRQMLQFMPAFARPFASLRGGMDSFEGLVSMAFGHPVLLALLATWPLVRGAGAIAGEIEHQTLGWMLAYPVGRLGFLYTKASLVILGAMLLPLVFVGSLLLAAGATGVAHAAWSGYLVAGLMAGLLYAGVGAVTLWASAGVERTGQAGRVGLGLLLLSYLWDYAARLWTPLKSWGWLSLFHYLEPRALLSGHAPEVGHVLVLAGVLTLGLVGAGVAFSRRELVI